MARLFTAFLFCRNDEGKVFFLKKVKGDYTTKKKDIFPLEGKLFELVTDVTKDIPECKFTVNADTVFKINHFFHKQKRQCLVWVGNKDPACEILNWGHCSGMWTCTLTLDSVLHINTPTLALKLINQWLISRDQPPTGETPPVDWNMSTEEKSPTEGATDREGSSSVGGNTNPDREKSPTVGGERPPSEGEIVSEAGNIRSVEHGNILSAIIVFDQAKSNVTALLTYVPIAHSEIGEAKSIVDKCPEDCFPFVIYEIWALRLAFIKRNRKQAAVTEEDIHFVENVP